MIRATFQNKVVPLNCKKFFWTTFVQCVTVWLVRIWAYKNADEKGRTCSQRSKNVKKWTKTDKKWILCKFIFSVSGPQLWNNLPTHIENAECLTQFKTLLKTYFFTQVFAEA